MKKSRKISNTTYDSGDKVIQDIQNKMNKQREQMQNSYRSPSGNHLHYDTSQEFSLKLFLSDRNVKAGFFMLLAGIVIAILACIFAMGTVQMILFILAAVISLTGTSQITSYINNCTTSNISSDAGKPKK